MTQAERLFTNCRDKKPLLLEEVDLRTALSRFYYSSFLVCQDFLEVLGYRITGLGSCHHLVINALLYSKVDELKDAGSDLGSLGTERRRADYDMDCKWPDLMLTAGGAHEWAKSICLTIVKMTARVNAEPALKKSLVAAIEEWKKKNLNGDLQRQIQLKE